MSKFDDFFDSATSRFNEPGDVDISISVDDSPVMPKDYGNGIPEELDLYRSRRSWEKSDQNHALEDDDRRLLDGGLRRLGTDILAFYKSKRYQHQYPMSGKWGIFYLETGILRVEEIINSYHPALDAWELALRYLQAHELFHYRFDVHALGIEALLRKSLYSPLRSAFAHRPIDCVEEALANKFAHQWACRSKSDLQTFSEDFIRVQPGAYGRYAEPKDPLLAELAAVFIDASYTAPKLRQDQISWDGRIGSGFTNVSTPPQYVITNAPPRHWIAPHWEIPKITGVDDSSRVQKRLKKRAQLLGQWENTKQKLIKSPGLPALDLKPWNTTTWSVRVNQGERAHLRPSGSHSGVWIAEDIGTHKEMGHG